MSAIRGDYRTHKHIPSRLCYQLIIEIPEADFPNACQVLGYPATGENTFVGIARINKELTEKEPWFAPEPEEKIGYKHVLSEEPIKEITDGDRLRIRSVILCKQNDFQDFCFNALGSAGHNEYEAAEKLYNFCNIKSRSELVANVSAQNKFKELLSNFDTWKLQLTYADNLNRG